MVSTPADGASPAKAKELAGLGLIRRMRAVEPKVRVLVFSMHNDPVIVARALEAGALGYVLKDHASAELFEAFERVRAGDLATRVEEGAADEELSSLSRAFNRMTAQLEKQTQALVSANRQIDDRRAFTEAVLAGVTAGVRGGRRSPAGPRRLLSGSSGPAAARRWRSPLRASAGR